MTRQVPRPQYRSTDYTLKYQVMLETLSKDQQVNERPFKFDAPLPTGVNDLNRPMLINTTTNKWKDMGIIGPTLKGPKVQQRKPLKANNKGLRQQRVDNAKNNGELAALSRLMERTTTGNINAGVNGKGATNGSQVKRSKSEPMYLPPIDEGTHTPGSRKIQTPCARNYVSPSYEAIKRGRKAQEPNKNHVFHRPDSTTTHILPSLSKVTEEKIKYKDGSFIKGVQRHTGKYNVNMALGRPPPRTPRYSWEDTSKPVKEGQPKVELNKPDVQQLPLRLRDMDLAFPLKNKIENIRQWHENQFNKHLEQWKLAGSEGDKKEEALKLLARYLERETITNGPSETQTEAKEVESTGIGRSIGRNRRLATEKDRRVKSGLHKNPENCKKETQNEEDLKDMTSEISHEEEMLKVVEGLGDEVENEVGKEPSETEFIVAPKPTQGRKLKGHLLEEHIVYTDADQYIEENNLLPPDKSRRIHDWLESIDLTLSPDIKSESSASSNDSNLADNESVGTSDLDIHPG